MAPLFSAFRRRVILPHRLIDAVAPLLNELAELLDGLGAHLQDARWTEASENLRLAVAAVVRKSKLYEHVAAIDSGASSAPTREAAPRFEFVLRELRALRPPRKGIAFVRAKLEAARIRRR